MLIADWMSTTVIKVEPGVSVTEAMDIQTQNDISILPVVQDEKLVGIVTDVDLKPFRSSAGASLDPLVIQGMKVEDVMSRAPVTIPVDFTVGEAAEAMLTGGVSGLVVVDANKHIVGVITQTDLNRVLVSVTGLWHGGIAFGFLIEDVPGSIKVLTDIMRAFGGRLVSIMTAYIRAPKGYRRVHIRVRGLDRNRFDEMLGQLKQSSDILYIIDHRMNTRKLYVTPGTTETRSGRMN
ncbi:MAG: CBS and ACT domain-containing protein [Syntrophobacteraceae bacterium]|nr:CBS and ACT domain-containing protein [Syntrophobacteraceae bacterium]